MLTLWLERKYNIVTASDGAEGLEVAAEVKPHLIILDINMPKMSGIEFYRRICDEHNMPKFSIIVLTARGELKDLFEYEFKNELNKDLINDSIWDFLTDIKLEIKW